ncbi:hypothetical protein U1Q18_018801 [Sarracenia purpurea var. burkii]
MASIRRTLSPVPRPGTSLNGTSLNGEACSVASPLSKSSSCTLNYPPPVGLLSSSFSSIDYALYRARALILGLFSKRRSRSLDRPRPKGQIWRRSLVHFLVCFIAGILFGLTPFASVNFSTNLMSKHQAFSFDIVQSPEKLRLFNPMPRIVAALVNSSSSNDTSTLDHDAMKLELQNGTSVANQGLNRDLNTGFRKLLIIVTPTYAQPFQSYYLNRLAHTLKLIPPPLLWIVVEMDSLTAETGDILRRNSGVVYRHLVCNKNLTGIKDRGVHQRNVALFHIETHRLDGIVYFADDSNIYSVELFEQMRQIRRFGIWPVAKLREHYSRALLEGPVCNGTQVVGWHTDEVTGRFQRFHAEMSGFALNSTILWDPKRWHRPTLDPIRQLDTQKRGFQVSTFIEQVVEDESQMECLPRDYSRIMIWHLHVESSYSYPPDWFVKNNPDVIVSLTQKF